MATFEERFEVQATPEAVWAVLLDPARLARCVPGCESLEVEDEARRLYRVRLTVRVGFLSTTQAMQMTLTEVEPPRRLVAVGRGEDRRLGSQVEVRASLELEPTGGPATTVSYRSEVRVLGRLGTVGDAVMRARAAELSRTFADRLRAEAEARA